MTWLVRQYTPYNFERWVATANNFFYTDQRALVFIEDIKSSSGFITKSSHIKHVTNGEYTSNITFSPKNFPDLEFTIKSTTDAEAWGNGSSVRDGSTDDASYWLTDVWSFTDETGITSYRNINQLGIMYPTSITCMGKPFKSVNWFADVDNVHGLDTNGTFRNYDYTDPKIRPDNLNMASKCWGISNQYMTYASGVAWDNKVWNVGAVYHGINDATGEFYFAYFDTDSNRLGLLNYFAPIYSDPNYAGDNPFRYGVLTMSIGKNNGIDFPIMTLEGFRQDGTAIQLGFTHNDTTSDAMYGRGAAPIADRASLVFPANFSYLYPVYKSDNGSPFIVGRFGNIQFSSPSTTTYASYTEWGTPPMFANMGIMQSNWLNVLDVGVAAPQIGQFPNTARIKGTGLVGAPASGYVEYRTCGNTVDINNNPLNAVTGKWDDIFKWISPAIGTPPNSPDPFTPDGSVNPEGTDYVDLYKQFTALVVAALDSLLVAIMNGTVELDLTFIGDPEVVKKLTYDYYSPKMMVHFTEWAATNPRTTDLSVFKSWATNG